MHPEEPSNSLLAHFDRPKLLNCPEFDWDEKFVGAAEFHPPIAAAPALDNSPWGSGAALEQHLQRQPTRGIGWVLQWAAGLAVLAIAAGVLVQFFCLASAERSLNVAAQAGATEATLPHATYESIAATLERRLASYPQAAGHLQFTILQNGTPITEHFRACEGDRVSITISTPTMSLMPAWLQKLSLSRTDTPMTAHAEGQVPGRKLQPRSKTL